MNINKEVRNYITRKVNEAKKAEAEKILAKYEKYNAERRELVKAVDQIAAKAEAEAEAIVGKHSKNIRFDTSWHKLVKSHADYCIELSESIRNRQDREIDSLEKKADLAIENIIVRLSLGGSAAELDALLADIKL